MNLQTLIHLSDGSTFQRVTWLGHGRSYVELASTHKANIAGLAANKGSVHIERNRIIPWYFTYLFETVKLPTMVHN